MSSNYRRYSNKHAKKSLEQRVGGLMMGDWESLGLALISLGPQIMNSDDMDSVLRQVKYDSRIIEPDMITKGHMRVAMTMLQLGRVDQMRGDAL